MKRTKSPTNQPSPPHNNVNLVADLPAEADQFVGHAHDSVAKAIAQVIRTERGGRVIGLEGSWGSGKSTIVGLVKSQLEGSAPSNQDPDIKVAVFDAWSHQNDPLRRTFLESLLDELVNWGWLSKSADKAFREQLSGKHITTQVNHQPVSVLRVVWPPALSF